MMATADEQDQNLLRPLNAELVPETGYLVVILDMQDYGFIEQPVRYQGRLFQPKSELHITIISQDGEKVTRHLEDDPKTLGPLQELIQGNDWRFRKLPAYYHVVEAPDVETIIQMVEIPGLEGFLRALSGMLGQELVRPPTHVTLYTRGTEKGIGLPTQEAFQELVKAEVQPQELQGSADAPDNLGADQGLV
jgi:hypothetical protein